jgi:hypothetical protein
VVFWQHSQRELFPRTELNEVVAKYTAETTSRKSETREIAAVNPLLDGVFGRVTEFGNVACAENFFHKIPFM